MSEKNDSKSQIVNRKAADDLKALGYTQELSRNRGLFHILFTFGLSAPFSTSLVGGGPATIIWGYVVISLVVLCLAISLGEISSRSPTSAGPYYWAHQLAPPKYKILMSWVTGWISLTGNWTIALSVNFGVALFIVAAAGIYHPDWEVVPYQVLLIFWAVTLFTMSVCMFGNTYLPMIDTICAWWTGASIFIILIALSAKAGQGRHSAGFALGHYDGTLSGWPEGFSFFIGLLPPAYTYAAIGMIASMAEEVEEPELQVPRAMVYSVVVALVSGLVFLLPIMFTLPDIPTLLAVPSGQPVPLMFELIMGSPGGGFGLFFLLIGIAVFCAISISTAASRATWAFARDNAIPGSKYWARVHKGLDVPVNALLLSTIIQMLLGLIYLGSTAGFNAFSGVGTICLGVSYVLPVGISLWQGRREISTARYYWGTFGAVANIVAIAWVLFFIVLFCMPAALPVRTNTMNYASVVFTGFMVLSAGWYIIHGRKHYTGPPNTVAIGSNEGKLSQEGAAAA
ncbi:amino acid/polyamine transporter I [Hysterangium stoloniferum]|nr:amino acid/polyamine transporter I [Hysterangium stoloniferum]